MARADPTPPVAARGLLPDRTRQGRASAMDYGVRRGYVESLRPIDRGGRSGPIDRPGGAAAMERAIEGFLAVTSLTVGASHFLRADAWVEVYDALHRLGRPGAFANGGLSLLVGAAVVAG